MGETDLSTTPPAPGQFPPPGYGEYDGPAGYDGPAAHQHGYGARGAGSGYPDEPHGAPDPGYFGQPTPAGGYPLPSGYGQPRHAEPLVAGVLGKRRNPFAVWLGLPIITLGVYCLVWIYRTNKELAAYDNRIKVDPTLSVLAFAVGWVLIVPPLVAAWRLCDRVRLAQVAAGVPATSTPLAFVICLIGGGALFLQFQLNNTWARYQGAVEGQQVPLFN